MHIRISAALLLAACGLVLPASAQEYCVTCSGPDAKYRCIIEGNASAAARSSRGQLLCITELAKSGNHESCSVGRTTGEPCKGEPRTVMFTSAAEAALPPLGETPPSSTPPETESPALAAGQPAPPEAPTAAPTNAPPQTVEELAKQTVAASGKGLKKAGEAVTDTAKSTGSAVGNAVSKTWKCMTSLFSDC